MKVAVVLHEDRHADPEIHLFGNTGAAVLYATRLRANYRHAKEDSAELLKRAGWLYGWTDEAGEASARVEVLEVEGT
jgi:hypothetical protein